MDEEPVMLLIPQELWDEVVNTLRENAEDLYEEKSKLFPTGGPAGNRRRVRELGTAQRALDLTEYVKEKGLWNGND